MSKRRINDRIAYTLLFGLLFTAFISLAGTQTHIIIMHTNDVHGHIQAGPDAGGSAALATVVRSVQPDLMLDAGDMFTGALISDSFDGEPLIAIMNAIGYDAAALGNHEFDRGLDVLRVRAMQANFPFLSANTISIDEVHDAAIFNAQGVRIAVIGATTEDVTITSHPRHMKSVRVMDVVQGVQNALPKVRNRADLVVLLVHVTAEEEVRLARAFPEVQLIIGGHEDEPLHEPIVVGNTTIVRTGKYGRYVGRVDLSLNFESQPMLRTELIPLDGIEPDPEIMQIIEPYAQQVDSRLREVLGQARHDLTNSTSTESSLQNFVADAVRQAAGTQIALLNVGGQRTTILRGPITGRALFEVLPFENTLVTMRLSGQQIRRILAHSIMAISGLRVRVDMRKPEGQRLVSVTLFNGEPLQDRQLYTVATNDFLLAGGDGFPEFANGRDIVDTGTLMRDAVGRRIGQVQEVNARLDGRIQVIQ